MIGRRAMPPGPGTALAAMGEGVSETGPFGGAAACRREGEGRESMANVFYVLLAVRPSRRNAERGGAW